MNIIFVVIVTSSLLEICLTTVLKMIWPIYSQSMAKWLMSELIRNKEENLPSEEGMANQTL